MLKRIILLLVLLTSMAQAQTLPNLSATGSSFFPACPSTYAHTLTSTLALTASNSGQTFTNYRISTTTGPCITLSNVSNVTISASNIGPCGGASGSTSANDSAGIEEVSGTFNFNNKIVDNYVHTETGCTTGAFVNNYTHDAIALLQGKNDLVQGNVVLAGNSGITTGPSASYNETIEGNFVINPTSSCYTGQGNGVQAYSQRSVVDGNYVIDCVLSGGGTDTGLNCSAIPDLITTPQHGGHAGGDSIAIGSYNSDFLNNVILATNNYIVGNAGDSSTCLLTWHGSHGATITGNIGVDCGGSTGASFDAVAGSGYLANNRSFNNTVGSSPGLCCSVAFEDVLQGASGDSNFVWLVNNNLGDAFRADGAHGAEYCGGGSCPASGVTENSNTFGAGADGPLTNTSTVAQIEAALGTPPPIPPKPYGCIANSPYTNRLN